MSLVLNFNVSMGDVLEGMLNDHTSNTLKPESWSTVKLTKWQRWQTSTTRGRYMR